MIIILLIIIIYMSKDLDIAKNNKNEFINNSLHYNGYHPHDIEINFSTIPIRTVALRPEIADTIIALNAGQYVIAAYIPPERKTDIAYFQKNLPNAKIYTRNPTKEEIILLNPDFIIGWNNSFSEKSLGDIQYWNARGIPTYIEENSGAIPNPYPPFNMSFDTPPFSVQNEIQFIKNMGKIFKKENAATREIDKIKNALYEAKALAKLQKNKVVLTMQFRRGKVEVLGNQSLSGDIIHHLGCENIDYEGLLMPTENLLMMNPDAIIIIYDYIGGDASLKNQLKKLHEYPYNQLSAVKQNHIGAMQYFNDLIATNVHTANSIWKVYEAIYNPSTSYSNAMKKEYANSISR